MSRKLILTVLLAVLFGCSGIASAAVHWDNETGNQLWQDPLNWDTNSLDVGLDYNIGIGGPDDPNECIVGSGVDANQARILYIAMNASTTGALLLDGGFIDCGQFFRVGYNGAGTFRSTGGTVRTNLYDIEATLVLGSTAVVEANNTTFDSKRYFDFSTNGDANWTLNNCTLSAVKSMYTSASSGCSTNLLLNNCTLNAGEFFDFNYKAGGTTAITANNTAFNALKYDFGKYSLAPVTYDLSGCTITTVRDMYLGYQNGDTAAMTFDGGLIDITQNMYIPYAATSSGSLDVKAGTIKFASLRMFDTAPLSQLNVDAGILVRKSGTDYTDTFQGYVDSGRITSYNGRGEIFINYDEVTTATTLSTGAPQWELAYAPVPGNTSTIDTQSVTLGWTEGDYVGDPNKHDVYFGTSFADVNGATTETAVIYKSRQNAATYGPITGLELGETYYWRIDEVNEATSNVWTGKVWSFTVTNNIIIDDFEDYNNIDPGTGYLYELGDRYPTPPAGSMWAAWEDGYFNTVTGSIIYDAQGVVHGGTLGMKFTYENDGYVVAPDAFWWEPAYYSEAEMASPVTDMTANNIKAIGIWHRGDIGNDAEPMYMALSDGSHTAVVTHPDANVAKEAVWRHWNIDLAEFTADNPLLELDSISKIMIGFGNKKSPVSGGAGTVYFDDIQLYVPRCVSEEIVGDLANGDCTITLDDVSEFVQKWLDSSGGLVTATPPDDSKQVVFYDFNDSGALAEDSSGNDANGTILLGAGSWNASGKSGGCAIFDGTYFINVPTSVFADINDQITVAMWVWGDPLVDIGTRQMVFSAGSEDDYFDGVVDGDCAGHVLVFNMPSGGDPVGLAWEAGTADPVAFPTGYQWEACGWNNVTASSFRGQWNHFAMTKNIVDGTMKLYCNGLLMSDSVALASTGERVPEATIPINHVGQFLLGGWHNYKLPVIGTSIMYFGKMDDFRIYKYELSHAEILSLAGIASIIQPTAEVDYNGDNEVNFEDYAMLVEKWLIEQVWP